MSWETKPKVLNILQHLIFVNLKINVSQAIFFFSFSKFFAYPNRHTHQEL